MVIYVSYIFGLLPFLPLKESMFIVPSPCLIDKFYAKNAPTVFNSKMKKFSVYCTLKFCKFLMCRKGLYDHLSRRGIGTIFWVVQNEAEFRQSMTLGAQGVMTDFPSRLSRFFLNPSNGREERDLKTHFE
jgi:hypothetical protein